MEIFASLVALPTVQCAQGHPATRLFLLKTEAMRPQNCEQVSGTHKSQQPDGAWKRSLPLDRGGSSWGWGGRSGAPEQGPLKTYSMQTTHSLFSSAPLFLEYCPSVVVPKHQVSSHSRATLRAGRLSLWDGLPPLPKLWILVHSSTSASQPQWACEFPRTSIQSKL